MGHHRACVLMASEKNRATQPDKDPLWQQEQKRVAVLRYRPQGSPDLTQHSGLFRVAGSCDHGPNLKLVAAVEPVRAVVMLPI